MRQVLAARGATGAALESNSKQMAAPMMRSLLAYDPAPDLGAITVPVLAVVGTKDLQVPAAVNIPALRAALSQNPKAEVVEAPGLNHLLQPAQTGQPAEYGSISTTIDPAMLAKIGDFVAAAVQGAP